MRLAKRGSYNFWLRLGVLVLCLLVPGAERLFSQADTGSITGTITDPAGAVLTNVKITIVAVATNRRLSLLSDNEGRYSSGPLRVGEYRVEAELPGFKPLVRPSVLLQVQQTAV